MLTMMGVGDATLTPAGGTASSLPTPAPAVSGSATEPRGETIASGAERRVAVMPFARPAAVIQPQRADQRARRARRVRGRSLSAWLAVAVLLALLLVEAVVLMSRVVPRRATSHPTSARPTTTTIGARAPIAARAPKPHGEVKGVVGYPPVIDRFAVVRGRAGQPDILVWRTRGSTRVTLDGQPAPAQGTRAVRPSVHGTLYTLQVANGHRRVSDSLRVVGADPLVLAASVPTALFNVAALHFARRPTAGRLETQTVHIVNLGPTPLAIARVDITGDRFDFQATDTCRGQKLPIDGACRIDVRFAPRGSHGLHSVHRAVLIVVDNTTESPHTLPLDDGA